MDIADAAALLPALIEAAGFEPHPVRDPIRVWARSGVERMHLAGGGTVVFKYAQEPLNREHLALGLAVHGGVPVPRVLAAHTAPGVLGMLLEDLGRPVRDAGEQDAAQSAVIIHRVPVVGANWLPRLDETTMAGQPTWIAARAARLGLPSQIAATAAMLARNARRLAEGANLPPYGSAIRNSIPPACTSARAGDGY